MHIYLTFKSKETLTLSPSAEELHVNWDKHESCFVRVTPRVSSEKLKFSFINHVLKVNKFLSIIITFNCHLKSFITNYFAILL